MHVEPKATGRGLGCLMFFRKHRLIVIKVSCIFFFFFASVTPLKNVGHSSLASLPDLLHHFPSVITSKACGN